MYRFEFMQWASYIEQIRFHNTMTKWNWLKNTPSEARLWFKHCSKIRIEKLKCECEINYSCRYHADINLAHAANLMKTLIRVEASQNWLLKLWQIALWEKKKDTSWNHLNHSDSVLLLLHKVTDVSVCSNKYTFLIKPTGHKSNFATSVRFPLISISLNSPTVIEQRCCCFLPQSNLPLCP